MTGCAQPGALSRPAVYDFGPGALQAAPASNAAPASPLAPLIVAEFESNPALDSTAVLYRLAYADAQQLKAYTQARWSMTPAQLLRQRLRDHLGQHHALINPGDKRLPSAAAPAAAPGTNPQPPLKLRIELEEFSQLFESADQSTGLLRLRATVTQAQSAGNQWLAQRTFTVQRPAPSADAPGGVRALTAATDAAVLEIAAWLRTLSPLKFD